MSFGHDRNSMIPLIDPKDFMLMVLVAPSGRTAVSIGAPKNVAAAWLRKIAEALDLEALAADEQQIPTERVRMDGVQAQSEGVTGLRIWLDGGPL